MLWRRNAKAEKSWSTVVAVDISNYLVKTEGLRFLLSAGYAVARDCVNVAFRVLSNSFEGALCSAGWSDEYWSYASLLSGSGKGSAFTDWNIRDQDGIGASSTEFLVELI